jgi:hypothetical protein
MKLLSTEMPENYGLFMKIQGHRHACRRYGKLIFEREISKYWYLGYAGSSTGT